MNIVTRGTVVLLFFMVLAGQVIVFAYEGVQVADGGSIQGVVKFAGVAPSPRKLDVDKDKEVCAKTPRFSEALLVSKGNGVKNAVVSLTDMKKGKALNVPKKNIEFSQEDCAFRPHVLTIPVGANIDILNNDPITHNIHTFSIDNAPINKAQPKTVKKMSAPVPFEFPETIKVQCDIHTKWMSAWFIVTEHPYYAVTDEEGRFRITDVPPGKYHLQVWHESLGTQGREVTVKAKEETAVSFELKEKVRGEKK